MMEVRINLLPPEILARREQKLKQRRLVFIGCGVLAIILLVHGALFLFTIQAKNQVQNLRRERISLESNMQGFERYRQFQSQVQQSEKLVREISKQSMDWVYLFDHVVSDMPPNLRLTGLSVDTGRKSNDSSSNGASKNNSGPADGTLNVAITGIAGDSASLGRWVQELKQVPVLSGVQYRHVTNTDLTDRPALQFEITGTVRDPGQTGPRGKETGNGGEQQPKGQISVDDINNAINDTIDLLNSSQGSGS